MSLELFHQTCIENVAVLGQLVMHTQPHTHCTGSLFIVKKASKKLKNIDWVKKLKDRVWAEESYFTFSWNWKNSDILINLPILTPGQSVQHKRNSCRGIWRKCDEFCHIYTTRSQNRRSSLMMTGAGALGEIMCEISLSWRYSFWTSTALHCALYWQRYTIGADQPWAVAV